MLGLNCIGTKLAGTIPFDESGEQQHPPPPPPPPPPPRRVPATPHNPFNSKGSKGGCQQGRGESKRASTSKCARTSK
eukprot:516211-Pelagomonas_calceolata.AAC.1